MSKDQVITRHSIIGVVGDVRREMSGHHYAEVGHRLEVRCHHMPLYDL